MDKQVNIIRGWLISQPMKRIPQIARMRLRDNRLDMRRETALLELVMGSLFF